MYDIDAVMKIAKSMKRPIVHVGNNYMLGTDLEFCTLSIIETNSIIPRPFTTTINGWLNKMAKDKYAQDHPEIFFTEYSRLDDNLYINIWEEDTYTRKLFELFGKVNNYLYGRVPIYSGSNFEKDENFIRNVSKLKVSDGLKTYTIDNTYLITSFNKVHCINASDKVSLNIYDIDTESYLYEFIIDKKKYIVKEYIRYRKMSI